MKKELIKGSGLFAMLMSLLLVTNRVASAGNWAECKINGRVVPCDQVTGQLSGAFGFGLILFLVILALGIWSIIFWIMMIVHVAENSVENRAMWIIIMSFTGIFGAIAYYFVVKRPLDKPVANALRHKGVLKN